MKPSFLPWSRFRRYLGVALIPAPFAAWWLSGLDLGSLLVAWLVIMLVGAASAAGIVAMTERERAVQVTPSPVVVDALLAHPASARALEDTADAIVGDGIARLEALANANRAAPVTPPHDDLTDELEALVAVEEDRASPDLADLWEAIDHEETP